MKPRVPIRLTAAIAAALLALSGCGLHHSRGWKLADVDRNWLNLTIARGGEDASTLAKGMPNPDAVLSAAGHAVHAAPKQDDPLEIVVRYGAQQGEYGQSGTDECFRFTYPDGHQIEFHRTDCPKG